MDLDSDGKPDILSGSYSRDGTPMAGLFQVLWGQGKGEFSPAEPLNGSDGNPLLIPPTSDCDVESICTRPMAVDWNADGLLDLISGNFRGSFYWFRGEEPGKFSPQPEAILLNGQPLAVTGAHSDPFPIDWDGDGDLDLVSGASQGGVYWSENQAGAGQVPQLSAFQTLIEPGPPLPYGEPIAEAELTGPTQATRVWVTDLDRDGRLDLLVGDSVTLVARVAGLSDAEYARRRDAWQKDYDVAIAEFQAATGDEEKTRAAQERFSEVYAARSRLFVEKRTGYVWFYRRK